jgi:polyisoprenyl-phosphate glycosyltransferase
VTETNIALSVVIPVYAGQSYLRDLIAQLSEVRDSWSKTGAPMALSEVILVDDAAIDGSPLLVDQLAKEFGWIVPLHLMRNFGQHAATIAGVLHSSGDWVVTMDEDLQHSPASIELLLRQAVTAKSDIVYAKPSGNVHEAKSRDWASRAFKSMMAALAGNESIRNFNSFRLIRGQLARAASSVCGYETYFDIALSWFTSRVGVLELPLKDARFISSGKSGYGVRKLLTHARRLLISSQIKVVRIFGAIGVAVVSVSMVAFLWVFVAKAFFGHDYSTSGWASLILTNLFFGGFITLMLALVLEYLSTLVLAANGKPLFFTVDRSQDERLARYFAVSAA